VSAQRKHALDRLSGSWDKNIALEVSRQDHWNGIADVIDPRKLLG
jgi:multimeric flavodoxin WrbA